jgi:hypothetical protein
MKIFFKICLYFVISASLFISGYFYSYKTIKKDKEIVNIVQDRFYNQLEAHATGVGDSMLPSLKDGETNHMYKIEPIEGDIVVFNCTKSINSSVTGQLVSKRLIKIREDGAWWVLGDNREVSHDSGDYGWILPSERSNVWVIKVK